MHQTFRRKVREIVVVKSKLEISQQINCDWKQHKFKIIKKVNLIY